MLINRPIMANSDIVKKLAQESPPTKGKSTATPHSHSPFSLHVSSPRPDRTSTSSGLPPPPGRVTRYMTPAATQRTSTDSGRSNPSFDVESVSQASSERLSIHSHSTAESNATSLKHAPYDDNAWKPGHVRHQTEAFGSDSSRSEANLGRVASSSSSSSRGQHVGQSSRSHHITGSQANTGPSNYQQRQTTSLLAPLSCVPHSGNSEEDTDVDSLEEPHGHSYPSSSTLPRHEIAHDINASDHCVLTGMGSDDSFCADNDIS
ncbi:hypothetical protein JB92DRAFT_56349 [Gautieria morchelliformis]|nr:hypothetical protein JB92DRAFT_56349 [Gautieria morchelliformis]